MAIRSVVLAELVSALGAVVEDGCALVCRAKLESVEVHLVVAAARALLLDGRFLWLLVVAKGGCCVDELTLLSEC